MIKKCFLGLSIIWLALSFPGYAKAEDTAALDKIVAIVNKDVITQREVDKKKELISRQMARNNIAGISEGALQKQVLDNMIYTLLQLQLAQRAGIKIDDSELDNIVTKIAKKNHMTVEQLKHTLQEQEGLSFKEYRAQLREQLIINQTQQRFLGKSIKVSEEDIKKVLRNPPEIGGAPTQYHVRDVLIEVPDGASSAQVEAATKIASQIMMKLQQDIDIEKIEKEYGSQMHSNDLGWRRADELPPLFVKEIAKAKIGQVVGPLRAPNGLHLVKLLEIQNGQSQPEKLTKEQAQEIAIQQKLGERLKPWLKELREAAYVKIID